MSDYLDTMHREVDNLRDISTSLSIISRAFATTGNLAMSDNLYDLAYDVQISLKNIDDAVGAEIRGQCRQAQESSANMIRACLAVNTINKGETL